MLKGLFIVALTMVSVSSATAQKKNAGLIKGHDSRAYGVAGCGLGSVMFGPKNGMVQVIAATFNGSSGNQSFGITFGTLNCDIAEAGMQAAVYLEDNREVVMKEAARGNGETLVGLANILKCSDQTAFNTNVKANYEKVFVDKNAYNNVKSLIEVINNNEQLKSSCNIAG